MTADIDDNDTKLIPAGPPWPERDRDTIRFQLALF